MDIQIIALWIGLFITFVLGLVNFLWGPAILAHRDKVVVVNSEVYPEFLPKGTRERTRGGGIVTLACAVLSIEAGCELVLTSGEKELEVKEVEVLLNKKACESLGRYFRFPLRNRFQLEQVADYEEEILLPPILLVPKKTVRFKRKMPLNCTDEFEKEHEKMESGSYPEFIQPLLDELETKYQIYWTRYDDKRLCWRFPQKWWRNLGKRLWG